MTKARAKKILEEVFRALPKRMRDRLEYHRQRKTPILCGRFARLFVHQGAG